LIRALRLFSTLAACALLASCNSPGDPGAVLVRSDLGLDFLTGSDTLQAPVPTAAFSPRPRGKPGNHFEGRLSLSASSRDSNMQVVSDLFGRAGEAQLSLHTLPVIGFELVQDGSDLIPVVRGRQVSQHPAWEWVLEAGQVWDEAGDGGWTRASLPFALVQRNANCTHNGLLTFLFKSDGSVSRAAYQVGSETCFYFQADLWGTVDAQYEPGTVENRAGVIRHYRSELAARLPVKEIAALADAYPVVDLARFRLHDPGEVTTYGLVMDGVHYSGGCMTRFGPYPYCQSMVLPSYSLAKTILAGTVYMQLERLYPGIGEALVPDYVPECRGDERWKGVTLQHLLDMGTGNYRSTTNQEDEFFSYDSPMFSEETHAAKIATACTLFPRVSEPGTDWVYHTSDTYIAGALMNAYLREQLGEQQDIFGDLLVKNVLAPLSFSPAMRSGMRSYDEFAQPFSGYGMFLLPDDIARFALFLLTSEGRVGKEPVLDQGQLMSALQRNPDDPGMRAGSDTLRYNNGMWAANILPAGTCAGDVWLPFMSGYGGISVVLMPNDSVYYVFSDGAHFKWADAAAESNQLKPFCENHHGSVQ